MPDNWGYVAAAYGVAAAALIGYCGYLGPAGPRGRGRQAEEART